MFKKLQKIDKTVLITSILLLGIGLFTLFSLTLSNVGTRTEFLQRDFSSQVIYSIIGVFIAGLIFFTPFYYFRLSSIQILIIGFTFILLILTLFIGQEIKGVKRWITIGSTVLSDGTIAGGITIQPSEFTKLAVIVISAALLSIPVQISEKKIFFLNRLKNFVKNHKYTFYCLLFNLVTIGLVLAQKSLSVTIVLSIIVGIIIFASIDKKGNAFLIFAAYFVSLIISQDSFLQMDIIYRVMLFIIPISIYIYSVFSERINDIAIFLTIILGIISGALFLNFVWNNVLRDYQRERVETFFATDKNSQDEAFQQEQAKISIGAGQFFGQGFREISDSRILLLPEPTTDFIFAIFSFKFGFMGSIIVIGLFTVLISRLFYLADKMTDKYSSLILIGVGGMILIQFFLNITMNLGLIPVGGTTLPFISAGGSSLITTLAAVGLALNVIANNDLEKTIHRRKDKVVIEGWNV